MMLIFMNLLKWPYSSHGSPSLQPSGRASSKGTQGLFSVKNLFGEENINHQVKLSFVEKGNLIFSESNAMQRGIRKTLTFVKL